jgi:signal transduction histidine kinase
VKRPALLFLAAVLLPALVLGALALRSLRDQKLVLERQQSLLAQGMADKVAADIAAQITEIQRDFALHVETVLKDREARKAAYSFDADLRQQWPMAQVGFAVELGGLVCAPSLFDPSQSVRDFRLQNDRFLTGLESVEVYAVTPKGKINLTGIVTNEAPSWSMKEAGRLITPDAAASGVEVMKSKLQTADAGFRQLVGSGQEGVVARFLQDELRVLLWYRSTRDSQLVFGAQLDLNRLAETLRPKVQLEPGFQDQFALALLNHAAQPQAVVPASFQAKTWRHPFAAAEVGEVLPHWEAAVYLVGTDHLNETAATLRWTTAFHVVGMLLTICFGGWLIVADSRRQLRLAQQKTDFVSNVSHELKTPLTSIRMFAELLAEGRVKDPERTRQHLGIITAEAARLTRLVNNVLDFARLERGEKRFDRREVDLSDVARETVGTLRPHFEAHGLQLELRLPSTPLPVSGDKDALAQVLMNLLSNAEKYAASGKVVEVEARGVDDGFVELAVLDRGPGVPVKLQEQIFEKFFRADDALSSGVQGTGLGLTLARQVARAHGGDVLYKPRGGGGGIFTLRLPAALAGK